MIIYINSLFYKVFKLSNGHSPQICQNGELLVRMCRGESHFSLKLAKASVGESGESVTAFWRIWRIWRIWWIFKLGRFMYKKKIFLGIKRSSLSSPNSPDSPNSPERVTKICSILAKFADASHKNLADRSFSRIRVLAKNGKYLASTQIC